ncbi:MAG: aldo/keto reductase [Planctomycetota bacterium]|nr:aldo/keto reductase [Planctomycetota bacterium]
MNLALLPRRNLGAHGPSLPRLGLGGHTFLKRFGGRGRAEMETLLKLLAQARGLGLNHVDVTYDEERELLGRLLKDLGPRESWVLSSWAQAKQTPDGAAVEREAERALKQMGLERLDLLYLEVDLRDDHARALERLKAAGKIGGAGLLGAERALAAGPERIDFAVAVFNYFRADAAGTLAALKARGLGTLGAEPLGRGRFLAEDPARAPARVAALLRYALSQPFLDAVLVTMRTPEELGANAAVACEARPFGDEDRLALEGCRGYEIPFEPWN